MMQKYGVEFCPRCGSGMTQKIPGLDDLLKEAQDLGILDGVTTNPSLMAKEGGFRPESIKSVVQATEAMRKIGISTEETVKAFAKVNKDPVQALIELGTQTGKVNVKVIELVANAMRNGEVYKATALATDEYARATKSAAEQLVFAWGRTYNIPYIITRTTNNYGQRQHE